MKRLGLLLVTLLLLAPGHAWACAVCYGASDSSQTAGMNYAIITLLGIIGAVLGGVAAFFIYLIRRARLTVDDPATGEANRLEKKEEVLA